MSEVRLDTMDTTATWVDACAHALAFALNTGLTDKAQNGWCALAGAGGSTPEPIYRRLSALRDVSDWQHTFVTPLDERFVPESSPDSNAALLKRSLLTNSARHSVFLPMYQPAVTVDRAAAMATWEMNVEMKNRRLDAVLLGMGEDGHIASMFPGSPVLKTLLDPTQAPAVLGVPAGRDGMAPPQERLSLNISALAKARLIVLALTGAKKRAVFEAEAVADPASRPLAALIAARAAAGTAPIETIWTEGS